MPADRRLLIRRGEYVAATGLGLFALACCGLLPAAVAFVGAAGLAALLGAGAAVLAGAGVLGALLVAARRRRPRHGCRPRAGGS